MDHKMRSLYKVSVLSAEPEYFKAQPLHFQVSFCSTNVKSYLIFLDLLPDGRKNANLLVPVQVYLASIFF